MKKFLKINQIREIDHKTISHGIISGVKLMEKAGFGIYERILSISSNKKINNIILFAGKGNNGGDVFACSFFLIKDKIKHTIIVFSDKENFSKDSMYYYKKVKGRTKIIITKKIEYIEEIIASLKPDILIDGLLGTGIKGALKEEYKKIINIINKTNSYKIAVDIPSGMDGDTGNGYSTIVDETITMGFPKIGMIKSNEGIEKTGKIYNIDLGFPSNITNNYKSDIFLIEETDISKFFEKKHKNTHKGYFGRPLIFAGSTNYPGAAILSCKAAIYANSGVTTLLTNEKIKQIASITTPELVYLSTNFASFEKNFKKSDFEKFTSLLAGPGITTSKNSEKVLKYLIKHFNKKNIILDADAINIISKTNNILNLLINNIALTPHLQEFARLIKIDITEIQKDRLTYSQNFSTSNKIYLILKGFNTIISSPDGKIYINPTGNPNLAVPGSGDVLSGILASFTSWKNKNYLSALLSGVYIHGLCGDILKDEIGSYGITALDIIRTIPKAINKIAKQ